MTDAEKSKRVIELLDELMELSGKPPLSRTLQEAMGVVGGELQKMQADGKVDEPFADQFLKNVEVQFSETLRQTFALASDQLREQLGDPQKVAELLKKTWESGAKNGNTEL